MTTSDDPEETPWEPLSVRERVCFFLVKSLLRLFRVDFFDMWRRSKVSWDEKDEIYRIGMHPISRLKDEWLEVYKKQAEFYDDNEDDEWVSYAMWVVMRADKTINPPTIIHGERQEDGSWEQTVNEKPPELKKEARKREILERIDDQGFIDSVLEDEKS